jgi:hypothetical protein
LNRYKIWAFRSSLDPTVHRPDPLEEVPSNQKLPRVGLWFKLESNRNSRSDLIQILLKSYLLIPASKNSKWGTVGILRKSRIHQYHKILYFMGSIWNHFQIGIKLSVSLLNS